ncbi:MAG: DUF2634 domain-containing protein [Christensenellales bacterium]
MSEIIESYPVFEIPGANEEEVIEGQEFKPCPLFDYEIGDFVRDGANRVVMVEGRDAYILWCLKVLKTQRGACLSYMDAGIDYEEALAEPAREAVQSALERTITDALMSHPCTDRIYDFEYIWDSDTLYTGFTIKPKEWASFDVDMSVAG